MRTCILLLEKTFNNQIFNIKNSEDDFTISDYISQHFGMKIGDKITYLSCHRYKYPKILKDDLFILSLEGIKLNDKNLTPIYHDKMTHLAINCVTMKELMDKYDEKTDMSDVICGNCSKTNGKTRKAKFEKSSQY